MEAWLRGETGRDTDLARAIAASLRDEVAACAGGRGDLEVAEEGPSILTTGGDEGFDEAEMERALQAN